MSNASKGGRKDPQAPKTAVISSHDEELSDSEAELDATGESSGSVGECSPFPAALAGKHRAHQAADAGFSETRKNRRMP